MKFMVFLPYVVVLALGKKSHGTSIQEAITEMTQMMSLLKLARVVKKLNESPSLSCLVVWPRFCYFSSAYQ